MKLGTIIKIVGGGTPSKSDESYWNGNIPWASVKDMKGTELWSTVDHISQAGVENSATTLIDPGAIIMATRMAPGRVIKNRIQTAINQDLKAIYPSNNVDVDFLFYFFKSKEGYFENEATGATVKGIKIEHIANIEIPLPPLSEQKRIAGILDAADRLRQQDKALIGCYNQLAQSVFLEMFGDPLSNPKGFAVRKLSECYINPKEGTKCGPFGSALKKEDFRPNGVPVWNMDNISKHGEFLEEVNLWIDQKKYNELLTYATKNGDVIISRAGTVGKMCVLNSTYSQSIISTNLIRVRFGADLLPLYFVSLMTHCKDRVGRLQTGAEGAFTHMNTGILDNLEFPYPPLPLQQKFAEVIENIEQQKAQAEASGKESEALFQSLLQSAFKGDL